MVEFGLKLEDNKVDEWSDRYIDYEKLKTVLKSAKGCNEYLKDLKSRSSADVVADVLSAHSDVSKSVERAHSSGTVTLETNGNGDASKAEAADELGTELTSQTSPLIEKVFPKSPKLGSKGSFGYGSSSSLPHISSWGQLGKIKKYFGMADDRTMLFQAFAEVEDKLQHFEDAYEGEVNKVNDFYSDKLCEITHLMIDLKESVGASHIEPKRKKQKPKFSEIVGAVKRRSVQLAQTMIHNEGDSIDGDDSGSVETTRTSKRKGWKKLQKYVLIPDIDMSTHNEDYFEEDDIKTGGKDCDGGEGGASRTSSTHRKKKIDLMKDTDSIKRAITEYYRTAKLLHNFSIMNYTGFIKIAKKFDKTFPKHKGKYKKTVCDDGKKAEDLAKKMERLYSVWFCNGDNREAQAQLLAKRNDGLMMDWTQLRLGYRLGMCSILALWVIWDCVWGQFARGEKSIGGRSAFPVFRACAGLLLLHWFWGMSVYVWTRFRINYIYLFDFDPRLVDTPIDIFNDAVDESLVYLVLMLLYYKAGSGDIPLWVPPGTYPLLLVIFAVKCLIFPWKQRKPMWITIRKVISSPFVSPTFFMTYVGDVFTSMVKVFQDILWTICFVVSGDWWLSEVSETTHSWQDAFWYKGVAIPLICLFPLMIRFNQCLRRYMDTGNRMPNLANAFKYAMSQSVTLFGAFHSKYELFREGGVAGAGGHSGVNWFQIFWMALFVGSSSYSFCWDVYMDWGLGRREHGFLGPSLMFPKKWYYYSVMCADLIMRFMWVMTLVPPDTGAKFEFPAYLTAISMSVELFRRTIWGFFRMENEHRSNTQGFRRVTVIPLHFTSGHQHNYNERKWIGWKILGEIVVVTMVVIILCFFSVIAAQKSNIALEENHHALVEDL